MAELSGRPCSDDKTDGRSDEKHEKNEVDGGWNKESGCGNKKVKGQGIIEDCIAILIDPAS